MKANNKDRFSNMEAPVPHQVLKKQLNIHYFTDDLKRTSDPNRQKSASQINRPDIHTKPTKTNLNILIKRRLINRFLGHAIRTHLKIVLIFTY